MGRSHSKQVLPNNPMEVLKNEKDRRRAKQKKVRQRFKMLRRKLDEGHKIEEFEIHTSQTAASKVEINVNEYDQIATKRLQDQLAHNLPHFLLNQLMLAVQFFGNYEREKQEAIDRNLNREKERNIQLSRHSVILPNVLDDAFEKRVLYHAKHGPTKNEKVALQAQTMYIVHENVEILKLEDTNYASISPTSKFVLDSASFREENWKGYVRLKLWEMAENSKPKSVQRKRNKSEANIANNYDDQDDDISSVDSVQEIYKTSEFSTINDSIVDEMRRLSNSTSCPSSSEYDYTYITTLSTHQPFSQLTSTGYVPPESSESPIPQFCISEVMLPFENNEDSQTEEDDSDSGDFYEKRSLKYLNSKAFLCFFASVFKDKLFSELGIHDSSFDAATWKGASIFISNFEIIPAIYCPWPNCAFEWPRRKRAVHENPFSRQKYQWPDKEMVERVVSFGCHVIPLGYAPKTGKNPYRDLEWKIVFPKAERYLETCLTNTQAKVFILAKALIKTFVEPLQDQDTYMFTLEHLRAHLFWQVEDNYAAWPEEYLGEVLIRFLNAFLDRLSTKVLPDYFLPQRNLFENIPNRAKAELHEIISRIIQNPVMHLLMTYRNLESVERFLPAINYRSIYAAIVIENPLFLLGISKKNRIVQTATVDDSECDDEDDSEDETEKQKGLIGYAQKKEKFDESKRRRTTKLNNKERERLQKEAENMRKISKDSIDLKFLVPENFKKYTRSAKTRNRAREPLENIRKNYLIKIFKEYFVSMADKLRTYKSFELSVIYLCQAGRMAKLLDDESSDQTLQTIEVLLQKIRKAAQTETETGPKLPRRTSTEPISICLARDNHTVRRKSVSKSSSINRRILSLRSESLISGSDDEDRCDSLRSSRKSVQFSNERNRSTKFSSTVQVHNNSPSKCSGRLHGIMKQTSTSSNEDSCERKKVSPSVHFQPFFPEIDTHNELPESDYSHGEDTDL